VAIALVLVAFWQVWHSNRTIGELRAELAEANADRAQLVTTLQAQEQRVLEAAAPDSPVPPVRSAEGLIHQPRLAELAARAKEFGFTPGSTSWHQSALAIPEQFTQLHSTWRSPGALVAGLLNDVNFGESLGQDAWELTVRVFMPEADQASAIIMLWGLLDDSIAGRDYMLVLRQHQGNWYVAEVQERFHCARNVVNGKCL
jgi:hypothetical protein